MGVGLLVGVWFARYLGPKQFGLYSYAFSFSGLFGTIAGLGLNGIVVRDLVKEPENTNSILGTAFVLQLLAGFLAFACAVIAISIVKPDAFLTKLMVAVFGFMMVLKATDVIKYWFESQVESKYTAWIEIGAFSLFSFIRVALILAQASIMAFVWAAVVELALASISLMAMYVWRVGKLTAWRVRYQQAAAMLKNSWPLILSGMAISVYMRIDQVMLGQMLGDRSVGIYSAAVRISELWYFIPGVIVSSAFPTIIEAKKKSEALYNQRLQKLYVIMVWLALAVALPMTLASKWIVTALFGPLYAEAGGVLAIHIWTGIFVFLGIASSNWFLIENLQKLSLYRTIAGAVINIILNIFLIPSYGAIGAAMATVVAQAFSALFFDLLNSRTRLMFSQKINAFNVVRLSHEIKATI